MKFLFWEIKRAKKRKIDTPEDIYSIYVKVKDSVRRQAELEVNLCDTIYKIEKIIEEEDLDKEVEKNLTKIIGKISESIGKMLDETSILFDKVDDIIVSIVTAFRQETNSSMGIPVTPVNTNEHLMDIKKLLEQINDKQNKM